MCLKVKAGSTVSHSFCLSIAAIKSLILVHGTVESLRTLNGLEFVDDGFKDMLANINIKWELTPVDGAKRNWRFERKLASIAEGARTAFAREALIWTKVSTEALSWMNACLKISACIYDKPDMLCPLEKLCGMHPSVLGLPFMMPGIRGSHQ